MSACQSLVCRTVSPSISLSFSLPRLSAVSFGQAEPSELLALGTDSAFLLTQAEREISCDFVWISGAINWTAYVCKSVCVCVSVVCAPCKGAAGQSFN